MFWDTATHLGAEILVLGAVGGARGQMSGGHNDGVFQYFFHHYHVLRASGSLGSRQDGNFSREWAGRRLVMAQGLLFPGSSAGEASASGTRRPENGIGLVPIFVVAGFLEGFVTRHTEMPLAASLAIIGTSAAFIGWYFVYYPRQLVRRLLAGTAAA